MSAIPVQYRRTIDDSEFLQTVTRHQLTCARAGATLFVLIPGLSRVRPGQVPLHPSEWLELLHSSVDTDGRECLRIVQDTRDDRHIGAAWTDAGLRQWRVRRQVYGAERSRDRRNALSA